MGSGASSAATCQDGRQCDNHRQASTDLLQQHGSIGAGVGDLFLTWAEHESGGGIRFDSSPAFVFAPDCSSSIPVSSISSSLPLSTTLSSAPSPADFNWPLFSPAPSTAAVSFADTPPTTAPSTTPASLLSSLSTPLLDQSSGSSFSQPPPFDIDWSSFMTMSSADPIMFPGTMGLASHHHSPSSSVGATLATSTATQSRTPPLSLSPAYSSETSPAPDNTNTTASNPNANINVAATGDNLQFLSFLDLSNLPNVDVGGANAMPQTVSMAPSVSTSSASASISAAPKVPGLTMSATSGVHKKSGAGGARVKKTVSPDDPPVDDDDLLLKRQRNSLAARKYRQKKLDRISELEVEVGQLTGERDALRIQLARQEAETAALREMLLVQSRDRERDDDTGSKRRKRK